MGRLEAVPRRLGETDADVSLQHLANFGREARRFDYLSNALLTLARTAAVARAQPPSQQRHLLADIA